MTYKAINVRSYGDFRSRIGSITLKSPSFMQDYQNFSKSFLPYKVDPVRSSVFCLSAQEHLTRKCNSLKHPV